MPSRSELYTEGYVSDVVTSILHPEFGTIYNEPDGEAYLAYQAGLTEGRAESTRKKKSMSESTTAKPPVEGRVVNAPDEIRPMTKVEAGVMLTVVGAVVTAIGFAIKHDIKVQNEREKEYKAEREERDARAEATRKARTSWFDTQRKEKKIVLELRDGSYIAISAEAYAAAEIKKKGQWL